MGRDGPNVTITEEHDHHAIRNSSLDDVEEEDVRDTEKYGPA
jgi:hypothetical protein